MVISFIHIGYYHELMLRGKRFLGHHILRTKIKNQGWVVCATVLVLSVCGSLPDYTMTNQTYLPLLIGPARKIPRKQSLGTFEHQEGL